MIVLWGADFRFFLHLAQCAVCPSVFCCTQFASDANCLLQLCTTTIHLYTLSSWSKSPVRILVGSCWSIYVTTLHQIWWRISLLDPVFSLERPLHDVTRMIMVICSVFFYLWHCAPHLKIVCKEYAFMWFDHVILCNTIRQDDTYVTCLSALWHLRMFSMLSLKTSRQLIASHPIRWERRIMCNNLPIPAQSRRKSEGWKSKVKGYSFSVDFHVSDEIRISICSIGQGTPLVKLKSTFNSHRISHSHLQMCLCKLWCGLQ